MIEGRDPVLQAFLGTLLTWGLTAAGAGMAFFIQGHQVRAVANWYPQPVANIKTGYIFVQYFCGF